MGRGGGRCAAPQWRCGNGGMDEFQWGGEADAALRLSGGVGMVEWMSFNGEGRRTLRCALVDGGNGIRSGKTGG